MMSHPELGDRQAIVDVCTTYALALDTGDWARLRTCFTEDAVAHYADRGESHGYESIEATCRAALDPRVRGERHHVHAVHQAGARDSPAAFGGLDRQHL